MTPPQATEAEGRRSARFTDEVRALLSAMTFLTRIPGPPSLAYDPVLLARSTAYFPIIGIVVGALGGGVLLLATLLWSSMVAAVVATAATIWVTGAFHEDALADACDGFGGGWDRSRVLAIMKDSRIGSYGAVGLALVLLAKITTLAALTESNVETAVRALVVGHVLGRWSSLPLIHVLPYVRDDAGKSRPFAAGVTRWRLTIGTAIAFAAVSSALAPLGLRAILVIVAWAIIAMTISAGYFRRRLGGMTGDCLGAANQLIEVTTYLLLASAWIRQ